MTWVLADRRGEMMRMCCRLVVAIGTLLAAGCVGPEKKPPGDMVASEVVRMPTEPNIVRAVTLYNSLSPWMWNEDRSQVRGIYVSGLYLLGPKGRGVFGDGIIRPKLSVVEKGPDGQRQVKQVKEWSFTVEEALLLRGKEERKLGWGYGLPLDFAELDLSGREVQVVVNFERSDGYMVGSSKATFRVP